jgi:hypothetical protein
MALLFFEEYSGQKSFKRALSRFDIAAHQNRDIGCSKTIYPNGVLLLWENPNCAHQYLRGIHGLHNNQGSSLEEMTGKTRTQIVKD